MGVHKHDHQSTEKSIMIPKATACEFAPGRPLKWQEEQAAMQRNTVQPNQNTFICKAKQAITFTVVTMQTLSEF